MADFKESALRTVSVFKASGLYECSATEGEILAEIERLAAAAESETCDPLMIIPDISRFRGVFVASFDDCNAYEEPGYYKNLLEEITAHSGNNVAFSDIEEKWGEDGVEVSFVHNGTPMTIQCELHGEPDMVPEAFTECLHSVLTSYEGEDKYLPVLDSFGGYIYYFLPAKVASELETVRDAYEPPF